MTIDEWEERRLEPRFGHQGQWLMNDLDRLQAQAVAAFALLEEPSVDRHENADRAASDTPPGQPSRLARRFLIATDLGLVDARFRPEPDVGTLTHALIPWSGVQGVRLEATTTMDDALRHVTRWALSIDQPAMEIADPPDDEALIDLWRECIQRAGRLPGQ